MIPSRATTGLLLLGLMSLLGFGLVSLAGDEPPRKDDPAAKDQQVVRSKPTARTPATSVNFRKELNLPFASLGTLGSRIEAARRAPDPVALAHAASELTVAEQVSGKTASLTSKQLIKESAQLAALRRQVAELRAVERVTNQVQLEEEGVAYLKDAITQAEKMTQQDKESFQRNEQPTSTPRQLVVNNYTSQYLDIYVNGSLMTQVQPGLSQVITIEQRWNPVVVTAYGSEDTMNWGPRYIWGRFTKYTWNIDGRPPWAGHISRREERSHADARSNLPQGLRDAGRGPQRR
jgi:hypothetical protein